MQKLRDKGNTVLVVEHDPDVIKVADHIIDVGPNAGSRGGQIVFEGSYKALLEADTLTAKHMKRPMQLKQKPRQPSGKLSIKDANLHNLRHVSVDIPTGVLTVVTGVAGSGKSTLIHQVFLTQHPDAIVIEHNLDVISQADWIIDMGPDGGSKGGQVVFEGTPSQIVHAEQSFTGKYLKDYTS